ncbi:hypothetical protein WOA01_00040 [Methylocystis sp. IM2]|jgi:hypothetical protein|uniref:hypothetical protein n=1 Tax=unclassified Methylocystis TaxID=2625913 RepID=UPI0030F860F5
MAGRSETEHSLKINPEFIAGRIPEGLDEIEVIIIKVQEETPRWKRFRDSVFENTIANLVAAALVGFFSAYIWVQLGLAEKANLQAKPPVKICEPTRFARSD